MKPSTSVAVCILSVVFFSSFISCEAESSEEQHIQDGWLSYFSTSLQNATTLRNIKQFNASFSVPDLPESSFSHQTAWWTGLQIGDGAVLQATIAYGYQGKYYSIFHRVLDDGEWKFSPNSYQVQPGDRITTSLSLLPDNTYTMYIGAAHTANSTASGVKREVFFQYSPIPPTNISTSNTTFYAVLEQPVTCQSFPSGGSCKIENISFTTNQNDSLVELEWIAHTVSTDVECSSVVTIGDQDLQFDFDIPEDGQLWLIILACAAGISNVIGITCLAWPTYKTAKFQVVYGKWEKMLQLFLNVALGLGGVGLFVIATHFGPVALAMPIQTGMVLLFNMILQGVILKMKRYEKNMITGTLVLVAAIVCLKDVGPFEQADQQPIELLSKTPAIIWNCIMGGMIVAGFLTIKKSESGTMLEILCYGILQSGTTVVLASIGKMMLVETGTLLYIFYAIYLSGGAVNLIIAAKAAVDTDQSIYMPVQYCMQLVLNCFTGLFVWQDYLALEFPVTYGFIYFLIIIGVYSCSSYDFVMTNALNAHMKKSKLSEGKATSSFGRAVQHLLSAWWYTPHDSEITHAALCKVFEKAVDTQRLSSEELVELIKKYTKEHGSEPSQLLMDWMDKDWKYYNDYLCYDANMRTVVWDIYQRASGRQSGIERALNGQGSEDTVAIVGHGKGAQVGNETFSINASQLGPVHTATSSDHRTKSDTEDYNYTRMKE